MSKSNASAKFEGFIMSENVVHTPFLCPHGCNARIPVSVCVQKGEEGEGTVSDMLMGSIPGEMKSTYMTE